MSNADADGLGRRKYPRKRLNRQIGFLIDGTYHLGHAVDMGEGGLSIAFKSQMPKDKNIVINFQIPGGSFVSVRAQIRNTTQGSSGRGYVLGCMFENLKFEHKREIRAYVSGRTQEKH